MSPQAIPWILCGALCLLPLAIGTGAFYAWTQLTNRLPSRDVTTFEDDAGRTHTVTDWSMLSREEKKFSKQEDEKE